MIQNTQDLASRIVESNEIIERNDAGDPALVEDPSLVLEKTASDEGKINVTAQS